MTEIEALRGDDEAISNLGHAALTAMENTPKGAGGAVFLQEFARAVVGQMGDDERHEFIASLEARLSM